MTTLAHMAANLRRLKRVPGWISLLERPISTGNGGSYANTSTISARKLARNAAPSKSNLDTQIASEELALAALIHSELMSIRLSASSVALSGWICLTTSRKSFLNSGDGEKSAAFAASPWAAA